MSSLYELTGEFIQLLEMLEDEDEDEQVILDTLEGIDYEIEVKAENYGKIIKNLTNLSDGLDKESQRLLSRKASIDNRIQNLKNNLENCMRATGKLKIKTDLFSFNIQKNGGKRALKLDVAPEELPKEYLIPQPDKVDNDKLREYIKKNGIDSNDGRIICQWCHLEPQSESLRIR